MSFATISVPFSHKTNINNYQLLWKSVENALKCVEKLLEECAIDRHFKFSSS